MNRSAVRPPQSLVGFLLVMTGCLVMVGVLFAQPMPAHSQLATIMNRVSVDAAGDEVNNTSTRNAIDADGSHVAFTSLASNLVGGDTNEFADIFVYETATGDLQRVSVTSGGAQGNGESDSPAISADGRYVAFQSAATNLVSGDTNSSVDIFVYDRTLETIERVSISTAAAEGNDHSKFPSISGDGQYVTFQSAATNLVASDTNDVWDVFVYDRTGDTTTRVSVNTAGDEGNNNSIYPALSDDGRYVTYSSTATDLVTSDTNGVSDIFIRDMSLDTTLRVSIPETCSGVTPTPGPGLTGTEADGLNTQPSVSEDGRYVAFESTATNLLCDGADDNGVRDIYVVDRWLNTIEVVSVASDGSLSNNTSGSTVDNPNEIISANGQYVVYKSLATNLVEDDTNGVVDVFVHDRQSRLTTRASIDSFGVEANGVSYYPSISAEGRYVGFYSFADNLVPGDNSGFGDVFVFDRDSVTPTTTPTITPVYVVTPTVTPTVSPDNPAVVYFPRNETSESEVSVNTFGGTVMLRCEKVLQAGLVYINVLSAPPVNLNQDFNIVPTNFDIYPNSDLVCTRVSVCLPYKASEVVYKNLDPGALRLFHYWETDWNDVTTSTEPIDFSEMTSDGDAYGRICGTVQSFSPFVIGTVGGQTLAAISTPTPVLAGASSGQNNLPASGNAGITFGFVALILTLLGTGVYLYRRR